MINDLLLLTMTLTKRQTPPLFSESAPPWQDLTCQAVINIWSWAPDWARHQDWLTDWLTVSRNVTLTLSIRLGQLRVVAEEAHEQEDSSKLDERIETRSTGEYRRSACEDFACERTKITDDICIRRLCVCGSTVILGVCDSVRLL
jgi:hypothetical protein